MAAKRIKPFFKIGSIKTNPRPQAPRPGGGGLDQGPKPNLNVGHQSTNRSGARVKTLDDYQDYVEGIRGRNKGLRIRRDRSRAAPIEDSMLGRPFDGRARLPNAVGERWSDADGQVIPDTTTTTVHFKTDDYTTERSGYAQMYESTSDTWTVPPGLTGIWRMLGEVRWEANGTGHRSVLIELNGATNIYHFRVPAVAGNQFSLPICLDYLFEEGDYFLVRVAQSSTGNLTLIAGAEYNHLSVSFVGYA